MNIFYWGSDIMHFIVILLACLVIAAIGALSAAGTGIAHFISDHMILIMIVAAIIFGIGLLLYWFGLTDTFKKKSIIITNTDCVFVLMKE